MAIQTLGTTTIGASTAGQSSRLRASGKAGAVAWNLATTAYSPVPKIYLAGGAQDQGVRFAVYADNGVAAPNNRPGALVAVSAQLTIVAGSAAAWRTLPALPNLAPGNYWFAPWFASVATGAMQYYYNATGGIEIFYDPGYSATTDPPSTYGGAGATSTNTRLPSLYIEYDDAPPVVPSTSGGIMGWYAPTGISGAEFTDVMAGVKYMTYGVDKVRYIGPIPANDYGTDIARTITRARVCAKGGSTAQNIRILLARNDATGGIDRPGTILATSPEITIGANAALGIFSSATFSQAIATDVEFIWIGIWFGAGNAQIQTDDFLSYHYYLTQTYAASGAGPGGPGTLSGTRGAFQAWFEYSVDVAPAVPGGYTRLTPVELARDVLVAVPNAGATEWSTTNWEVPLTTTDGGPRTLLRTGKRFEMSEFYVYVSGDPNLRSSYRIDLSPLRTLKAQTEAAGRWLSFRVRLVKGPEGSSISVPRFVHGPRESSTGAALYGFFNAAGGFIPDFASAQLKAWYIELMQAIRDEFDDGSIPWIAGVGIGQYGEGWFGGFNYDFRGDSVNGPGNRRSTPVAEPSPAWIEDYHADVFALFVNTKFSIYVNSAHQGLNAEIGYNLMTTFGDRLIDEGDFWGEKEEWDNWTRPSQQFLALRRSNLHRRMRGGEPSEFPTTLGEAWKATNWFRYGFMGNGNMKWAPITDLAQQALAKKTYLTLGYRFAVAHLDVPTTVTQGTPQNWHLYLWSRNMTAAPDLWTVKLRLRGANGQIAWTSATLALDLREAKPTGLRARKYTESVNVSGLAGGTYTVELIATHTRYGTLRFAQAGRLSDGGYPIGTMTITSATPVPGAPTIIVNSVSDNEVELSWPAVATATGYNVYRKLLADSTYVFIGTTNGTDYLDQMGLVSGETYNYKVRAKNAGGEGADSNVVTVLTLDADPIKEVLTVEDFGLLPDPDVSALPDQGYFVAFTWLPLPGTSTTYRLERLEPDGVGGWTTADALIGLSAVGEGAYLYTQYIVPDPERVYFRIRAENNNGIGQWSDIVEVVLPIRTPLAVDTVVLSISGPTSGMLTWTNQFGAENPPTGFSIYLRPNDAAPLILFASLDYPATGAISTFALSGLQPNTLYRFGVAPRNQSGEAQIVYSNTETTPDLDLLLASLVDRMGEIDLGQSYDNGTTNSTEYVPDRGKVTLKQLLEAAVEDGWQDDPQFQITDTFKVIIRAENEEDARGLQQQIQTKLDTASLLDPTDLVWWRYRPPTASTVLRARVYGGIARLDTGWGRATDHGLKQRRIIVDLQRSIIWRREERVEVGLSVSGGDVTYGGVEVQQTAGGMGGGVDLLSIAPPPPNVVNIEPGYVADGIPSPLILRVENLDESSDYLERVTIGHGVGNASLFLSTIEAETTKPQPFTQIVPIDAPLDGSGGQGILVQWTGDTAITAGEWTLPGRFLAAAGRRPFRILARVIGSDRYTSARFELRLDGMPQFQSAEVEIAGAEVREVYDLGEVVLPPAGINAVRAREIDLAVTFRRAGGGAVTLDWLLLLPATGIRQLVTYPGSAGLGVAIVDNPIDEEQYTEQPVSATQWANVTGDGMIMVRTDEDRNQQLVFVQEGTTADARTSRAIRVQAWMEPWTWLP